MARLDGQVALVIGAAVGLGRGYAKALARSGQHVVLCDTRPEVEQVAKDLQRYGVRALSCVADVSSPSDVRRVVDDSLAEFGRIDILIADAGIWRGGGPKDNLGKSLADYDALIGVNLRGANLFGRAVIPAMIAAGGGHMINIATDHVHTHPGRPTAGGSTMDLYDTSKWALNGLTDGGAQALAPHNIRMNVLAIGPTDTEMLRALFKPGGKLAHLFGPEGRPDRRPHRRLGRPANRTGSAQALGRARPRASGFHRPTPARFWPDTVDRRAGAGQAPYRRPADGYVKTLHVSVY